MGRKENKRDQDGKEAKRVNDEDESFDLRQQFRSDGVNEEHHQ